MCRFVLFAVALAGTLSTCAQDVPANPDSPALKQIPGLRDLPDRTEDLQALIDANEGNLTLPAEKFVRITRPLIIDLQRHGAVSVRGVAGTTLIMDGPGPAIRLQGTHQGTASPKSFRPETWNERMPLVSDLEILGAHPDADGIELFRTVEPTLTRVAVRWCRHGIHLAERNRNVQISDCHLYENSGVGVYLDNVDLHQINVCGCHISYNRQGGVVVRDGNVRNLQVSGCDIEGNMPDDETPTIAANILIDLTGSADDASRSVAEISITGCTIQHAANYSGSEEKTVAPGGSNIRLAGKAVYPIDSVTITGNVLSDTTTNIDISYAHDIAVSANTFFAPKPNNLRVIESQRVVVSGNTFNPRQFQRPGTILFRNCEDCVLSSSAIHRFETLDGAVILDGCSGMTLSALNLSDCGSGLVLTNTTDTTVIGCRVTRTSADHADIRIDENSRRIQLIGNSFSGVTQVPPVSVKQ
ncbi:MAG: right-handed parallel beta-helix repeat-containing protein [Planctomycetaceae bacterium]|nr:right-handed parallel beta-helix repeat-containing protein [Planctomycetaceae bacterium]